MKKLLLALTLFTVTKLSHGMEEAPQQEANIDYSKLSPITLPQIYNHFADMLSKDIAQQIFSLQSGSSEINEDLFLSDDSRKATYLKILTNEILNQYGYCYAIERLNRYFSRTGISLCDIKNSNGETVLHDLTYLPKYNAKIIQLFLQIAGDNVWKLLAAQKKDTHETALHRVTWANHTTTVKLLLHAAGDNIWALLSTKDYEGGTVLHRACDSDKKKLILDAAGNNAWKLLAMQDNTGCTILHYIAELPYSDTIENIRLILDTAGEQVAQALMLRQNTQGKTALDVATPEGKKVMLKYFKKNNQ